MFRWISSKRFVYQLMLVFILFTLATVVVVGIPVLLLLNQQTESQMQAVLEQASQTTVSLYENKLSQLSDLSALIVARPTLNRLVFESDDQIALDQYLDELLGNATVDVILVCQRDQPIGMAGPAVAGLCAPPVFNVFSSVEGDVWLLVHAPLGGRSAGSYVILGQRAESILSELSTQSGLDYVLFDGGQLIATTRTIWENTSRADLTPEVADYPLLALNRESPRMNTHMAGVIPLPGLDGFTLIGLLDITAVHSLSGNVQRVILATLVVVILASVAVAYLVSRQISRPLNRLAQSARALREGDLSTALPAENQMWEIDQVTNALEDARVSLKHSLERLKLEKDWIENLMNAVVEGLLAIDEHKRITFASEAIEKIVGVRLALIIGHGLDDVFITPHGEALFSQQLPKATQSRRIPVVINGREALLSVSVSRLVPPEAGDASRALVLRDVTDEERIHRLIGEFLANITHEFRTPLTALSASVELLMDQLPSLSASEIEQLLHALNVGIIDLQALIDNLIEAASIEAGRFKVNPQPVPLGTIIADAIRTVEPIVLRHGLHLYGPAQEDDVMVHADRRRTCQALVNILSNAIKHSPEGSTIRVTSEHLRGAVRIEVHDQGKGVPAEQRSKLFNRFITPGNEGDESQLGLGLGLSVVKAIVEAQQGAVGFRESESGGAVFWLTLPLVEGNNA